MRYDLIKPITGKDATGAEVVVLDAIDLRLPTVADVKKVKGLDGVLATVKLLELLGGVPKELADKLSVDDLFVLDKITDGFFDAPEARAMTVADAWLKAHGLPGLKTSGPPGPPSS